ncbi:hypothetical protein [Thiothrix lacustris]|uniref:hypothetical protein n=1 Tax=Thiothrix lacustris TaxID=525917 RepID=UPI0027E5417A|nr:hypothetical protein [Thiothrix lacustris]WMP17969.1 hypothetical protein RCS87_02625 [Thiothrix lacustris]
MQMIIRRLGLVLLAVPTLYLITSYGIGHVGAGDFIDTRRLIIDIHPDSWAALDSDDWFQLAEQAQELGDSTLDQTYTLQALAANITSGRAMARLADIRLQQGQQAQAKQLAQLAAQLVTAEIETHLPLAFFWAKVGNNAEMVKAWDMLFIREPSLRNTLFPHMRAMAINPSTASLVDAFASKPPVWWGAFFNYLATDAQTTPSLLEHLHGLRINSSTPIGEGEMTAYIKRLVKDKRWVEAHKVWLSSLPKETSAYQELVYDGGFEGAIHNTGFDWFFERHAQIKLKQDMTFGMEGQRALKISFNNSKHVKFQHLWQRLLLKPAHYELSLRVRADQFRTDGGLQWRMRCAEDNQIIAESPVLKESTPWIAQSVAFDIPPSNCETQLLRLEAASTYAHDQVFAGAIWLDAIQIHPLASDKP